MKIKKGSILKAADTGTIIELVKVKETDFHYEIDYFTLNSLLVRTNIAPYRSGLISKNLKGWIITNKFEENLSEVERLNNFQNNEKFFYDD